MVEEHAGDDPATRALAAALPEIRSVRRTGWLICLAVAAVTATMMVLASRNGPLSLYWMTLGLFPAFFVIKGVSGWVRGRHERAVLPTIAGAFGLTYEKSPAGFFETLPQNFIPQGDERKVDDMMTGMLAGRAFRFAECRTETGGNDSSVLFQGVVIEVQSGADVPEFLIASERETRGLLLFKGNVRVDGMEMIHSLAGPWSETYGLWMRSGSDSRLADLKGFMGRVVALGPRVLGDSTLYSLISTGSHYFISLRHQHDLFRIGGMFSSEDQVIRHIRSAATELAYPIELVGEVLQAEQALLAAK